MTQSPMTPSPRTSPPPPVATRGLGAVLRVPGLPDVVLPALLRYSAADPLAVRLVLLLDDDDGGAESVEWLFLRSELTQGLTDRPAGSPTSVREGDVEVRVDGHEVSVGLAGSAAVVLPLAGLVEFLADSYTVVPTGTEPLAGLQDGGVRLLP